MDNMTFKERIEHLVKIKKPGNKASDANPKITAIHTPKPCEDCGNMVKGRVVEFYIKTWTTKPQWTKECNLCDYKETLGKRFKKPSCLS